MARYTLNSGGNSLKNNYPEKFDLYRCCVIIPTYNNAGTLSSVINGVLNYTRNIIVVNDGSTDNTREILKKFDDIEVFHQKKNQGKGLALREGFRLALTRQFDYAITIDSDGQHNPHELPEFIDLLAKFPDSLVVGARNMNQESVPGKSSFGHKFSNFWYRVETGIKLPDTQSGFRLYPIKKLSGIHFYTSKFEFEIEILVRAAWRGISVNSIPVSVYYAISKERISHFRPFKDFFRISILNTILVLIAFLYARPLYYIKNLNKKKLRQLLGSGESAKKIALAIGLGAFMGIIPIWGYQMIAAVTIAHFLKLNKPLVILATNISFVPLIPFILYFSLVLGKLFVSQPIPLTLHQHIDMQLVKTGLIQYISGSILLATIIGSFLALVAYISINYKRKRQGV